jgi:LmbE family N-acetylglucosaminyl deacetylase
MQQLILEDGATAIVIVAHPDDETIWMGGTILRHKKVHWIIFSLCRAGDYDRAPKFHKVCAHFKADAFIDDLEDEDQLSVNDSVPLIKKMILRHFNFQKQDAVIFTHGENGEYGHPRHLGVNLAVRELIREKIISVEQVMFFHYQKKSAGRKKYHMIGRRNPDFILELSSDEYQKKKDVMTKLYGFSPQGIDANLCTNPEFFTSIK